MKIEEKKCIELLPQHLLTFTINFTIIICLIWFWVLEDAALAEMPRLPSPATWATFFIGVNNLKWKFYYDVYFF